MCEKRRRLSMGRHKSSLTLLAALVIFFGLGVCDAFPSSYYVDFAGGSDSNSGTSQAAPWAHCPGDPEADGNPADVILSPGDKVYFKGGVQYNGEVDVNWSGSSGNTITYDGNSADDWGIGRAIIDAQAARSYCFNFPSVRNYVIINNFELRNAPAAGASDRRRRRNYAPGMIYAPNASSHVEVANCAIHDTGNPAPSVTSGMGIWTSGSYWKIHDNLMYDCYDTAVCLINGASYNRVYNNIFHDKIRWGVVVKSDKGATVQTDNSIHDNYFHDIYYYDGLGPHTDWVFLSLTTKGRISNTRVYNNLFANSKTFTDYGGTAVVYVENSGENGSGGAINNTLVYNNVVVNQHEYFAADVHATGGDITNTCFYNNSFYTSRGCALLYADTFGTPCRIDGLTLTNNVWAKSSGIIMRLNGNLSNISIDYNSYCSSRPAPFKLKNTHYSWADWRDLGYDANSMGPQSDPGYVNAGGKAGSLSLGASSPVIGAGANLSSVFKTDKDNRPRPQSGTWCMGAYEFPR
jgi:hypothetical protein